MVVLWLSYGYPMVKAGKRQVNVGLMGTCTRSLKRFTISKSAQRYKKYLTFANFFAKLIRLNAKLKKNEIFVNNLSFFLEICFFFSIFVGEFARRVCRSRVEPHSAQAWMALII